MSRYRPTSSGTHSGHGAPGAATEDPTTPPGGAHPGSATRPAPASHPLARTVHTHPHPFPSPAHGCPRRAAEHRREPPAEPPAARRATSDGPPAGRAARSSGSRPPETPGRPRTPKPSPPRAGWPPVGPNARFAELVEASELSHATAVTRGHHRSAADPWPRRPVGPCGRKGSSTPNPPDQGQLARRVIPALVPDMCSRIRSRPVGRNAESCHRHDTPTLQSSTRHTRGQERGTQVSRRAGHHRSGSG